MEEATRTTVHRLKHGATDCEMTRTYGFPRDWPRDHAWVAFNESPKMLSKINCPGCSAARDSEEKSDAGV